jgi:hypothetical protein
MKDRIERMLNMDSFDWNLVERLIEKFGIDKDELVNKIEDYNIEDSGVSCKLGNINMANIVIEHICDEARDVIIDKIVEIANERGVDDLSFEMRCFANGLDSHIDYMEYFGDGGKLIDRDGLIRELERRGVLV